MATTIIGYDYEGNVGGTLCAKCHKLFTKQDATWLDGTSAEPICKDKLAARDSHKLLFIECGECGKAIWGKAEM